MPEAGHQYGAANRVILGIFTCKPGSRERTPMLVLPVMIQMAAEVRQMNGDFGAARILEAWAEKSTRPAAEWED